MILSGMRAIHTQQNGQMLIKVIIAILIIAILFFTLILNYCSADWFIGDGRGDWNCELCNGYAINKINSREILLVCHNTNDSGDSIVISNYFVKAYQMYEPYICLKGIQTQGLAISEDELNSGVLTYYLINTTNNKVYGPFESYDEFKKICVSVFLELDEEWKTTDY